MSSTSKTHFNLNASTLRRETSTSNANSLPAPVERSASVPALMAAGDELSRIKDQLGFFDGRRLDRQINRQVRDGIADAYGHLIEAKKQQFISNVTLGLSEAKKQAFVEHLRRSGEMDREIVNLSSQFSAWVFGNSLDASLAAAKTEQRMVEEIEAAYKQGAITQARFEDLRAASIEAAGHVSEIAKDIAARIIKTHLDKVDLALRLFQERELGQRT